MAPRLKVFVASDGLTDFVVAATSRVKALAAWGLRQDVFKEGLAQETDDPALVAAATARPGEVLRRPAGSRAALARLEPVRKKPRPKAPSAAAVRRVADLERRLSALEAEAADARAAIARARAELDRRAEAEASAYAARREELEAELRAAKQAPG